MKRIIALSAIILLLAIIGILIYNNRSSQDDLTFEQPTSSIGDFPILNGMIAPSSAMSLLVDTGCDLSMITPETVRKFKEQGLRIDSTFCPVTYRDQIGKLRFTTKRYTVDIPVNHYKATQNEDGTYYYHLEDTVINTIKNVDFVPAPYNTDVLGLDFLKKYAVEYRIDRATLTFHTSTPTGYEPVAKMSHSHEASELLGCNSRFSVPLEVSGRKHDFFIDSSLDLIQVKLPAADSVYLLNPTTQRSVILDNGCIVVATVAEREWAQFGNRSGSTTPYFYDDADSYAINPFNFTLQDVLLDFTTGYVCLRPHFDVAGYPRDKLTK